MNHKIAKEIIEQSVKTNKEFNDLLHRLKENMSNKEYEFYKKGFAQIMGIMLIDIINPIIKEHPELKPKELD